jgi:hypothetical protein
VCRQFDSAPSHSTCFQQSQTGRDIRVPELPPPPPDIFPPEHAVEVFGLLGGGRRDGGWDGSGCPAHAKLAILPGLTHYTIFSAPVLAGTVILFLDEAPAGGQ